MKKSAALYFCWCRVFFVLMNFVLWLWLAIFVFVLYLCFVLQLSWLLWIFNKCFSIFKAYFSGARSPQSPCSSFLFQQRMHRQHFCIDKFNKPDAEAWMSVIFVYTDFFVALFLCCLSSAMHVYRVVYKFVFVATLVVFPIKREKNWKTWHYVIIENCGFQKSITHHKIYENWCGDFW